MPEIKVKSMDRAPEGRGHWLYKEGEVEYAWVYVYRPGHFPKKVPGGITIEFDSDIAYTIEELEEIVRIAKTLPFD